MARLLLLLVVVALPLLLILAGASIRMRIRQKQEAGRFHITDRQIRLIEETGTLTVDHDAPLDLEGIREEEDRFWAERWDEPEEI